MKKKKKGAKRKGGDKDPSDKIILITAIANLIRAIVDLIEKLIE